MRRARICHIIWAVSAAHGAPARHRETLPEDVLRPLEFSPVDAERALRTGHDWLDELTPYPFMRRPAPQRMRAGEAFLVPHSDRDPAQIKPDRLRFEKRLGQGGVNNVYRVSYHANWAADGFDPEKAAQCMRLLPVGEYRKARNAHIIGGQLFLSITDGRSVHTKPTHRTHSIRKWQERWALLHCGSGNIYFFEQRPLQDAFWIQLDPIWVPKREPKGAQDEPKTNPKRVQNRAQNRSEKMIEKWTAQGSMSSSGPHTFGPRGPPGGG